MSPTKPLDVVVLQRYQDGDEAHWERYEERGEKMKKGTHNWSCYILATEDELFAVRCTNTTKQPLAFQISVDTCCIQQYLLRPKGEAGDTAICYGTKSHSMAFGLVSALTRAVGKLSRPPSETGCIDVTVYQPSGPGNGLPPPENPLERLDSPVNMDGTFWKLCVRLLGGYLVPGEPSPQAAEISKMDWKPFATMSFNYRTADELFSGRVRGVAPKRELSFDTPIPSAGKRKRKSTGDIISRKRRDWTILDAFRKTYTPTVSNNSTPSTSRKRENDADTVWVIPKHVRKSPVFISLSEMNSLSGTPPLPTRNPKLEEGVMTVAPDEETDPELEQALSHSPQVELDISDDSLQKPTDELSTESAPNPSATVSAEQATEVTDPAANPTEFPLPPLPPQPQPQVSVVVPTITPPSTPHTNPERGNSAAVASNQDNHTDPTLTGFLDKVSTFRPLGLSSKDLQEAGISTLMELRVIARNPEAFREKIPLLANLCERNQYLWVMFRWELRKLLEGEHMEPSVDDETDPVRRFVFSMGGGECIDVEEFMNGLRGAGVSSENDLLVLSRNLERYAEHIPFLREFAASKKFGWTAFQVGLEGLPGRKVPIPILTRDHGVSKEGRAYVEWFLDTVDPEKPLGYLADKFIEAGLTDRTSFLHIAEVIDIATEAMPLFRGFVAGDHLVWAMILVGFENLLKSA